MIAAGPTTRVQINNLAPLHGHLNITQTHEVIRSNSPAPDYAWTFEDTNGHFHAFDKGGDLPTLNETLRHVDCDGSCGGICRGEGYTTADYTCVLCDEAVEPGSIPGPHSVTLPTPVEWDVALHGNVDPLVSMVGQKVIVRVVDEASPGEATRIRFGVAIVAAVTADGDAGTATLIGAAELGEMAPPAGVLRVRRPLSQEKEATLIERFERASAAPQGYRTVEIQHPGQTQGAAEPTIDLA